MKSLVLFTFGNLVLAAATGAEAFDLDHLKPGTCVQFSYGNGWETATIAGPKYAGGYPVNWRRRCFGARNTATCPDHKVAINNSTARLLVTCEAESIIGDSLHMIADLSVQVGSARPYNPMQDSMAVVIDARQPVCDIRGSYTIYQCGRVSSGQTPFAQTHNCYKYPATAGGYDRCYTDTFGTSRCVMTGGGPTRIKDQAPPQ